MGTKRIKAAEGFPNWSLLSRALSNHDPNTAYTLLSERYPAPVAGRALHALIKTVPDWPKPDLSNIQYEEQLTHRELQVLRCAERGLSVIDTAKEIIISEETVYTYRKNIMLKLNVRSILEAVHFAHELGLIE